MKITLEGDENKIKTLLKVEKFYIKRNGIKVISEAEAERLILEIKQPETKRIFTEEKEVKAKKKYNKRK